MVGGDRAVAQPFGQRECGPFDQAAGVGEHECRAVGARQFGNPVVHLGPHFRGHDRFERRRRHFQRQVARAVKPLVDHGARGVAPADQEVGDQIHRTLRGRQPDAAQAARARVRGQRFEPFEGHGEMGATLVARHGVDLVHDHGVRLRQCGTARFAAEQDVERLRGGDQDMGGLACHGLARGRRRVAGAHHAADGRGRRAQPVRPCGDAAQRRLQVALHVVGQRLERRDIDDAHRVIERPGLRLADEFVDDGQKRGQRLAGPGRRGDQRVSARLNARPRPGLTRGRRGKRRREPAPHRGQKRLEASGRRHAHGLHHAAACCNRESVQRFEIGSAWFFYRTFTPRHYPFARASIFSASAKSSSVIPPASCVFRSTRTWL